MAKKIILLSIFIAGSLLRLLNLSKYPVGFHSQEAIVGYRANCILTTGKDELGRKTPLLFSSFVDYQLPVQTYLTVISTKLFGLNPFAVRFPGAIMGSLVVLAIYGLAKVFFNEKIALWSAFLAAISPWTVFLSRVAFPQSLSFSFFVIGLLFLLKINKNKIYSFVSLAAVLFCLYCSKTSWFIVFPLLVYFSFWDRIFFVEKRRIRIFLIACFVLFLPLLWNYLRLPSARQSLIDNDFSLFTDISLPNGINSMRGDELKSGSPLLGKIFYNKLFWGIKLAERIFGHFSPYFYFAKGEQNSLHGLWNFGPIFLIFIFPFTCGLFLMLKKNKPEGRFFLSWFIIVATISSFLKKSPDLSQLIFSAPIIFFLIAQGIVNLPEKIVRIFLIPLIIANFLFVFYDALVKEPLRSQETFYYGFEEISLSVNSSYHKYDKVYLSDGYAPDPLPLFLFYSKFPSEQFLKIRQPEQFRYRLWLSQLGNIYAGKFDKFNVSSGEKTALYVTVKEKEGRLTDFRFPLKDKLSLSEECYKIEGKFNDLKGNLILLKAVSVSKQCVLE